MVMQDFYWKLWTVVNLTHFPTDYQKQVSTNQVWQRVTGATLQAEDIVETYRVLVTKESPDEKVILRDIHR